MITFGIKLGDPSKKLHHIMAVPNGLACECVCPSCGEALIARNHGQDRQKHFAHRSGAECAGAHMTILHALAQEILADTKLIYLPEAGVLPTATSIEFQKISKEGVITMDEVALEQRMGGLRPDAIGVRAGKRLLVEILVTHEVDQQKSERMRDHGVAAIEIDLRDWIGVMFTREQITEALLSAETPRKWIVHPESDTLKTQIEYFVRMNGRCPHGLGFTGKVLCDNCPCLIEIVSERNVRCTGGHNVTDIASLNAARKGEMPPPPEFLTVRREQADEAERHRRAAVQQQRSTYVPLIRSVAKPTHGLSFADVSEYCDTNKIIDSGKRYCMQCGKPLMGYAGRGRYQGRTVWLCQTRGHRGIFE